MSQYITKTYGPGDIAALPPTIGLTSRAPTIGAEDVGHPIKKAFPFQQAPTPGAVQVEAAGAKLPVSGLSGLGQATRPRGTRPIRPIIPRSPRRTPRPRRLWRPRRPGMQGLYGLGTNANGNGNGNGTAAATNGNGNGTTSTWMLPVGIGLMLGGLYAMLTHKKEAGGIFANIGDELTYNGCD